MDTRGVTFLVAACLFAAFGLGGWIAAVVAWARTARRLAGSVRVRGVVVGHHTMDDDGTTLFAPIVRFTAPDGRSLVHRAEVFSPREAPEGAVVMLCCPPDAPEQAVLDRFFHKHFMAVVFAVIGLLGFGVGGWLALQIG